MGDVDLRAPRYEQASLADLLPAVLARAGVAGFRDVLGLDLHPRVIVLLVDGLGWAHLREHADLAPLLAAAQGQVIDTVFPSTTVTALASLGTGLPPATHGLAGYSIPAPGRDTVLNLLDWTVGYPGGTGSALETYPPERFQSHATAFERAARSGLAVTTIGHPDYVSSGLTRAVLRGARYIGTTGLQPVLDAAVGAATQADGRALVYAHHGAIDSTGHASGPGSEPWRRELALLDAALERVVAGLEEGVSLLVTADHGMVAEDPAAYVELADEPELMKGVRVLAGEPRVRQLRVEEGAAADVVATWGKRLGPAAVVRTRDQALAEGWFGDPGNGGLTGRIGDVVVAMAGRNAIVHRDLDPHGGRLPGMHGSLTRDEVEVPLLVFP